MILDRSKLNNIKFQTDGSIICMCPACAENGQNLTSKNHLKVWKTNQFNCIIDSSIEHNKQILKLVGIESDENIEFIPQEPKVELPKRWPLSTLDRLIKDYSYWESRGITGTVVEKFGGGIATQGSFKNRWTLPIYNKEKTEIVGFTGRSLTNQKPFWLHNGKKSEWIFSHDISSINERGYILIVESPADVLKLATLKRMNSMALFGTTISDHQIGYLIGLNPNRIFIGTNNEPGNAFIGNFAAEKIRDKLLKFFNEDKIKITLPIGSKDFAEKNHNWHEWSKKYESAY